MSDTYLFDPPGPVIADGITRAFDGRTVLDNLSFTAAPGTRLAVVGENGAGKTTLLRILAGVDRPDAGQVRRPTDLVYVPQDPDPVAGTVTDLLDTALRPLREAVRTLERLSEHLDSADAADVAVYDRLLAWASIHDAWSVDERVAATADALGVAALDGDRPVSSLSGGQRTRLSLAAALVRRPAVLILDEPTNHLDPPGVELLERELPTLPGVLVFASHDRTFLDRVPTHLLDLDPNALGTDGEGGRLFGGGWSAYVDHRDAALARWAQTHHEQQQDIRRLRAETKIGTEAVAHNRPPRDGDKFIYNFKGARVQKTVARRVAQAEQRLAEAERSQLRKPPRRLSFDTPLTAGAKATGEVVHVRDLLVHDRLQLPRLDVTAGEHLLVTGPNGSGKSTLLNVIAGGLSADEGSVRVTARRIGLLPQDVTYADPHQTPSDLFGEGQPVTLRELGLLLPRDEHRPVGALSAGQRRRLALAVLIAQSPDLLLLDEPTNHLSLQLAGELEDALGRSPGTVLVATHDRWLTRRWAGPTLALR
ncbi:ABC-F family ATP-binding cassette domain-containing protein [Branchiibius sp. NY16-3462-2]|uniref:ABC-F family ATP-binding cassette domain-containing protein n=1 Tax=Branchiibius sp. NY16-3462-2 TaxID=1807500 RepID=UPI000794D739|nr:ABC-F family ATP-binding cassette domain-containing protein [Branchiibius sp. NY16-3462-2]KYH46029.1 antibiotic ABC transporter ATP-binding protein [Branchiibius sp. NY16-3462-2]